jgi:hypothetical protein
MGAAVGFSSSQAGNGFPLLELHLPEVYEFHTSTTPEGFEAREREYDRTESVVSH